MSTAVAQDYRLQVSYKFGMNGNGMVNIRAQDADELDKLLADLVGKGPDMVETLKAFEAVVTVSAGMPGTTVVNSPAQTSDSSVKYCGPNGSHGAMKFIQKPDYAGHFCPLDKSDPNRCKPVYVRKG